MAADKMQSHTAQQSHSILVALTLYMALPGGFTAGLRPGMINNVGDRVLVYRHVQLIGIVNGGASVNLHIRGKHLQGLAEPVVENKPAVDAELNKHLPKVTSDARYYGVTSDGNGNLKTDEVEKTAQTVVMVRVQLC